MELRDEGLEGLGMAIEGGQGGGDEGGQVGDGAFGMKGGLGDEGQLDFESQLEDIEGVAAFSSPGFGGAHDGHGEVEPLLLGLGFGCLASLAIDLAAGGHFVFKGGDGEGRPSFEELGEDEVDLGGGAPGVFQWEPGGEGGAFGLVEVVVAELADAQFDGIEEWGGGVFIVEGSLSGLGARAELVVGLEGGGLLADAAGAEGKQERAEGEFVPMGSEASCHGRTVVVWGQRGMSTLSSWPTPKVHSLGISR